MKIHIYEQHFIKGGKELIHRSNRYTKYEAYDFLTGLLSRVINYLNAEKRNEEKHIILIKKHFFKNRKDQCFIIQMTDKNTMTTERYTIMGEVIYELNFLPYFTTYED